MTEANSAESLLGAHLAEQAGLFLRSLPDVRLGTLRRVGGVLHTYADLLDPDWSRHLREDLAALGAVLGAERGYGRRLARLLGAMDSLTGVEQVPAPRGPEHPDGPGPVGLPGPGRPTAGLLSEHPGAPKARALLERQLTLARSRSHTTALQELGSARFHSLADRMTLLVSDLPLRERQGAHPAETLLRHTAALHAALGAAVAELPMGRAAVAYNGDALHRLTAPAAEGADPDDRPWRQVWTLVQQSRSALEVCGPLLPAARADAADAALEGLAATLERHNEAADAAQTAALAARTPRITPATAYVLGVVHADQRLEVEAARHAFGTAWPDLARSGWLTDSWLARLT